MNQTTTPGAARSAILWNRLRTFLSKPHNVILLLMGIVVTITTIAPIVAIVEDTFKIHPGTIDAHLTGQTAGYTLVNYIDLFTNGDFGEALWHTVYFTIGTVHLGTILAILVAVLLNQKIRGLNLYKTAFFIPVIVSYTSIAMVWQWLYNDDFGLINSGLNSIGLPSVPWLTSSAWAMPSVIIMSIWKSLGFNSVILLAGVQGVSPAIYEAADIDGANVVQKFFRITLPMLKPTVMFVMIISMINSFQAFDQIYIMTKGGPGTATQVVSYLVYMNAFQYFKQGYASAMAYILFIIIFVASIIQLKVSEKNSL